MTNYNLIKEMFKLQDQFNEYTVENWKEQALPWHRAIWLECAEAIESLDWKWWKHTEPDMANVKVELVDIWHFLMSYNMIVFPDLGKDPEKFKDLFETAHAPKDLSLVEVIESLAALTLEAPGQKQIDMTFIFFAAWKRLGFTVNDLYKEYVIKNVLNKFRQDNGYKTGTYHKTWLYEGEHVEDNVVAWKLSEIVENEENLFNELYEILDTFYNSMPKHS